MTEYREVAIALKERKRIVRLWKKMGCRCLKEPWAEPWTEGGVWISYHYLRCPVVFTHDRE